MLTGAVDCVGNMGAISDSAGVSDGCSGIGNLGGKMLIGAGRAADCVGDVGQWEALVEAMG
jgi:hypothetical protein